MLLMSIAPSTTSRNSRPRRATRRLFRLSTDLDWFSRLGAGCSGRGKFKILFPNTFFRRQAQNIHQNFADKRGLVFRITLRPRLALNLQELPVGLGYRYLINVDVEQHALV